MTDLISGSALARELGCARSAVTNWVTRDILPDHLKPVNRVDRNNPAVRGRPVWDRAQLPAFREWRASHAPRFSLRNTPTRKFFLVTVDAPEEFTARVIQAALITALDAPDNYPLDVSEWDVIVEDLHRKEEKP
jgi:hypothetical protein